MGDDRASSYQEGNVSVYRASAIGDCLTALVASSLGYDPARSPFSEKVMSNAAKEGNLHEQAIIDTLVDEHGWRIDSSQGVIEFQVIPRVIIRGHIDGKCRPKGKRLPRLLEAKTMSRDRFRKWMSLGDNATERLLTDEFESYAWQVSAYMHQLNMPAMYVVKNRDSGILDISEIARPLIPMADIEQKIIEAEMWRRREELPPCMASSGDKFFCSFPYLHNGEVGAEPEDEGEPVDDAMLGLIGVMAERYYELVEELKPLKPLDDERKTLGGRIVDAMGGKDGPKTVFPGEFRVTRGNGNSPYTNKITMVNELGVTVEEYDAALVKAKENRPYYFAKVTKPGDKK